jgi:hypothetical protein
VLASPGALDAVLACTGDGHPAVAGEARGVLLALARASPDVQKITAYNGAFDKLLGDVRAAGGVPVLFARWLFVTQRSSDSQVVFLGFLQGQAPALGELGGCFRVGIIMPCGMCALRVLASCRCSARGIPRSGPHIRSLPVPQILPKQTR